MFRRSSQPSPAAVPESDPIPTTTTTTTTIKTYHVVNQHTFRQNRLEIHHDSHPILWTTTRSKLFKPPQITLHTDSQTGPVVAACKLKTWSCDIEICLGEPDQTGANFERVTSESWMNKSYRFHDVEGRAYRWKRTHSKDLGASRWGSKDFKLVDGEASGAVLAVFVHTQSVFGRLHQVARIEYFVDMSRELELASLAAILGIEEVIAQAERSAAAGGVG